MKALLLAIAVLMTGDVVINHGQVTRAFIHGTIAFGGSVADSFEGSIFSR